MCRVFEPHLCCAEGSAICKFKLNLKLFLALVQDCACIWVRIWASDAHLPSSENCGPFSTESLQLKHSLF
jgi:hypothetical protein